jgi:predicted amidophosphoribosyltransferase
MSSEPEGISPEFYQKLVTLSELMIEKNDLIEIIGEIKQRKSKISQKMLDILTNKFNSKINLIDKQMSRTASGLSCSVCQEPLELTDPVLACLWCGSPGHQDHLLRYLKEEESRCPSCGEYLRVHFKGSIKTSLYADPFKTSVYALSDKIHKLNIIYKEKPLELDSERRCPKCERVISQDWNFCRHCGTRLEHSESTTPIQTIACPRCGRPVKSAWRNCRLCGYPL